MSLAGATTASNDAGRRIHDPGRHPGGPPPRHAPALDAGRPPGGAGAPGALRRRPDQQLPPTLLPEYTLLQQTNRAVAAEELGARPGDSESRTIDAILFGAMEEAVLTYTATRDAEFAVAKGRSDHLIAALAHDIRTPLNAMALTLKVMEMSWA